MPLNCCVPICTKKLYRTDDGEKISFFQFPKLSDLRKKWIHAIRRDEGEYFTITKHTRVCSRHFKPDDLKKSLSGIITLKPGAVPSKFSWSLPSPAKRKPPKERQLTCMNVNTPPPSSNASMESNISSDVLDETVDNAASKDEYITYLKGELQKNLLEVKKLEEANELLRKQVATLQLQVKAAESLVFRLENFTSDKDIALYTGFPNFETLKAVFNFLNPGAKGENIRYCKGMERNVPDDYYGEDESDDDLDESKRPLGRQRALRPLDEFFLVMCRLRRGFSEANLAHLFGVSQSTVSRIFIPWIHFMYLKFGNISIWPPRNVVQETMPEAFKLKYSSTRVIIDCTEIRCQMPSSLLLNSELFSSYKNHVTLKGLVGIAPCGALTFISQLYTGNISDREIVTRSGFLQLDFDEGDEVMADN